MHCPWFWRFVVISEGCWIIYKSLWLILQATRHHVSSQSLSETPLLPCQSIGVVTLKCEDHLSHKNLSGLRALQLSLHLRIQLVRQPSISHQLFLTLKEWSKLIIIFRALGLTCAILGMFTVSDLILPYKQINRLYPAKWHAFCQWIYHSVLHCDRLCRAHCIMSIHSPSWRHPASWVTSGSLFSSKS